ncbi:MAG: hypothetical protein NT040_17160 [Bacteroidetes bacterium]|nr:hypothetical protein [Bacteroidota bacterium]
MPSHLPGGEVPSQLPGGEVLSSTTVVIDFTSPDTVCVGGTVNITNLSQGAATWYWNFCSGNANTNPTGVNIGNPGSLLSIPTYITLVKEGNNCYSFISCQGVGVIRYFHGTSFANNPISWTNLGQFGLINFNEEGIQVKYDNGNWYGFVNSYTTIIRLNFGNSLANTPTATDIGPFPTFNMPHGLVITKVGSTWLGFVTCSLGQSLSRLNFGTSLANIPILTDFGSLGGVLIQPFSICLVEENALWYAMIMASGTSLARITFGSSLLNPPTGVNLGNPGGFNAALGMTFLRDCESTTGYWTNYLPNGQLGKLTFPSGITGPVTGTILGNIGGLARPSLFSELFRENDNLYAYICNRDNGTLTRLTFPPCTNASVPSSTLFTPPPYSYNQAGTYNIHLILDEGLPTMASLCKPVVVMEPPVINLGNDRAICPGSSVILDAGALYTSYLWSNGATTRTITVSAAGTYSVTATRWGCTAGDEVVVSMLTAPQVDLGLDVTICAGQTHTFNAGLCNGCTYQWANLTTGQPNIGTGPTYTTGTAGEYQVTVLDANNCPGSDVVQLFVDPLLPVSISITASSTTVCEGTAVDFTAFATTGGSSPLFQWKVNGTSQGANSSSFTWIPADGDCVMCTLTSSNACTSGNPATSNQICMTVTPGMTVGINIAASANPVCAGTSIIYTATPVNGGTTPAYQWVVNGINVPGATNSTYSLVPVNASAIQCILTTNEACISGSPAASNIITMTVNPLLPVGISIAATGNPVCAGNSVTFTATPVNGGSTPAYQWLENGLNVPGATSPTYTFIPVNGTMVQCVLTSNETCTSGNPATSNTIVMTVNALLAVSLSVAPSSNPVCSGTLVTYTAIPVNGGTTPLYQWMVNGAIVPGATNLTYSFVPANGNTIECMLTSNESCSSGNPATSNLVVMSVNPLLPVSISIAASANPVCAGTSVTFTATPVNGGPAPGYQWMVSGGITGSNDAVFVYTPITGDLVSCMLSSGLACVSNNPATSGTILVSTYPVPDVSFGICFDNITTTNAKPFKLKGGLPPGGTYSGPGVNSFTGVFDPAIAGIGTQPVTYSYTNTYSCTKTATVNIENLAVTSFTCGRLLTDIRDNKTYPTVQIGTQCWMQANLDFGFGISELLQQTDNCVAEHYFRNSKFVDQYSIFYQWDELMRYTPAQSSQGICPPGWHVPTAAEWDQLLSFNDGAGLAGGTLKDMLLSNGFQSEQYGIFYLNKVWSFTTGPTAGSMYWTSTPSGTTRAVARGINDFNLSVSRYEGARGNAFPVRCLRD